MMSLAIRHTADPAIDLLTGRRDGRAMMAPSVRAASGRRDSTTIADHGGRDGRAMMAGPSLVDDGHYDDDGSSSIASITSTAALQ